MLLSRILRRCKMDQEIQIAEVSEQEAAAIARLEQIIFSDAWSVQAIQETWRQPCALVAGAKLGRSLVGSFIMWRAKVRLSALR